jgi:hypothetical protein
LPSAGIRFDQVLREGISRMNWAWASSLDHLWHSPALPMWVTLAAAGFFGIIVLITLLRAEKSVANGALTVITLLAIGIAVAGALRGYGPASRGGSGETRSAPQMSAAALPALSCIDDLAGDTVLSACEKALFGSPESAAAAVTYMAFQITRLTALGDAAIANRNMTADLQAVRHALERDRYGLAAQVLVMRERCTPTQCAAFRSLTDTHQIASNMEAHVYEGMIARYSPTWNAPAASVAPVAALAPTTMATGRPTNADFPTAASTPAVSIMTPEPTATTPPPRSAAPAANAPKPPAAANAQAPAKEPPAAKPPRGPAPVPIAPASVPAAPVSAAPAASND